MNMIDGSAGDEEQLASPASDTESPGQDGAAAITDEAGDYGTLFRMTRPLGMAGLSPLSLPLSVFDDEAIWLETGNCPAEAALKRGEILRPDKPGLGMTDEEKSGLRMAGEERPGMAGDEECGTAEAEAGTGPGPEVEDEAGDSNLKFRIYLGMS